MNNFYILFAPPIYNIFDMNIYYILMEKVKKLTPPHQKNRQFQKQEKEDFLKQTKEFIATKKAELLSLRILPLQKQLENYISMLEV